MKIIKHQKRKKKSYFTKVSGFHEDKLFYSTRTGRFFMCLYIGDGVLPESGILGHSSDYILLLEDGTAKETDSFLLSIFLMDKTYLHIADL